MRKHRLLRGKFIYLPENINMSSDAVVAMNIVNELKIAGYLEITEEKDKATGYTIVRWDLDFDKEDDL